LETPGRVFDSPAFVGNDFGRGDFSLADLSRVFFSVAVFSFLSPGLSLFNNIFL